MQRCPDVAKSVYQRGHSIGLHGYDHRCFPLLSEAELHQSLAQTQAAIAAACQLDLDFVQKYCRHVRPPNGVFTPQILQKLNQWSYQTVMWSVVPEDWQRPGVPVVVSRVLKQVQNGSIIVLHDGNYGGQDVAPTTDLLLPQLLEQGYQLVTIEQMWTQNHVVR